MNSRTISFFSSMAEPPPETTTLRLLQFPSGCQGPLYVAEELLRGEGFTDVRYVKIDNTQNASASVQANAADLGLTFSAPFIGEVDRGIDLVTVGGVHAGCFVLFGNRGVRGVRDLKGKVVSVPIADTQNTARMYIASMAAYVGLDPSKDITWVTHPIDEATRLFADGKVDAIMGFPPLAQELRARKVGHVVVDSTIDRPWQFELAPGRKTGSGLRNQAQGDGGVIGFGRAYRDPCSSHADPFSGDRPVGDRRRRCLPRPGHAAHRACRTSSRSRGRAPSSAGSHRAFPEDRCRR